MSNDYFVHESSYIDDGVTIGRGTATYREAPLSVRTAPSGRT